MMELALEQAKLSGADIPVGAIIVRDGQVISSACNRKEQTNDVTAHAEVVAIKQAAQNLGNYSIKD